MTPGFDRKEHQFLRFSSSSLISTIKYVVGRKDRSECVSRRDENSRTHTVMEKYTLLLINPDTLCGGAASSSPIIRMKFIDCYSIFLVQPRSKPLHEQLSQQNSALINTPTWNKVSKHVNAKNGSRRKRTERADAFCPSLTGNHYSLTCHRSHSCQRSCKRRVWEQRRLKKVSLRGSDHILVSQTGEKKGTRVEQRERRMWRQSLGWIKKKRERIPAEGGGEGGEDIWI